jgi:hypothetical protein
VPCLEGFNNLKTNSVLLQAQSKTICILYATKSFKNKNIYCSGPQSGGGLRFIYLIDASLSGKSVVLSGITYFCAIV